MINLIRSAISLILAIALMAFPSKCHNDVAHETNTNETDPTVSTSVIDNTEPTIGDANNQTINDVVNDLITDITNAENDNVVTDNTKPVDKEPQQGANVNNRESNTNNTSTVPDSGSNTSSGPSNPSPSTKPQSNNEQATTQNPAENTGESNPKPPASTQPTIDSDNSSDPPKNETTDDGSYDGDTAVPDDVYNPQNKCTTHNLSLIKSETDSKYELFSYITKTFQCDNCSYTESRVDIESNKLSHAELRQVANGIVNKVNNLRASNGLNTLSMSSEWNAWADMRAKELSQVYGHSRPGGGSWMTAIGSTYTLAENVASGQSSGSAFFNTFSKSSSHRSNMLSPYATMIAVGIYVADNGTAYCAMILISQ